MKTDTIIAYYEGGGGSAQGLWASQQPTVLKLYFNV